MPALSLICLSVRTMQIHSMQSTVVIGLGNPLMSDEGIGIHLVRALASRADRFPSVEFLDLGTSGMTVLHALAGRRLAVILDCACMREPSGAIRCFTPDQVASVKDAPRFSLHDGDLMDILALSRQLGEYPAKVVIYGIQPASLEMGESLSAVLSARFEEYLQFVSRAFGES